MRNTFLLLPVAALAWSCTDPIAQNYKKDDGVVTEDGEPNLNLPTLDMDFGRVLVGSNNSRALKLENNGGATLTVSAITATSPFSTSLEGGLTLSPSASTSINVRYSPTDYAAHEGSLTIESDDPDDPVVSVDLYGEVETDVDGDGWDAEEAGGDDCDDDDPTVYPGAQEIWYDGKDQDCAGDDDYDQDADGYQVDWYNADTSGGGGDCNDTNPDIYPGAVEVWYDNVDSNCDGRDDWDADGDGYRTLEYNKGSDCDDFDPLVYPGATEIANGKDNDCNGVIDDVE